LIDLEISRRCAFPIRPTRAVRDLVRAREDGVRECRNARHRLKALLLRNGIAYAGKSAWTAAHLRWLATLKMEHAAQQIGFQEYLHSITEATTRIGRFEQAMRDTLPLWTLRPLVQALMTLRGLQLVAAMMLVAELQDFMRFESPRKVMAYVGLVPGERSSGPKIRCHEQRRALKHSVTNGRKSCPDVRERQLFGVSIRTTGFRQANRKLKNPQSTHFCPSTPSRECLQCSRTTHLLRRSRSDGMTG
jgi:hypothetical protein